MIIYKTTCLINNKIYIGQSKHNKNCYLGSGRILLKSIKKYGKLNFKKEIIVEGNFNKNLTDELEKHYIRLYNSTNPKIGYNVDEGGFGNTEQQNKRIAKSNGKRIYLEETIIKMRNAKLGKKPSEETRKKLSKSREGNKNRLGIKHDNESKRKIREGYKKYYESIRDTNILSIRAKEASVTRELNDKNFLQNFKELQIIATKKAREVNIKPIKIIDTKTNIEYFVDSVRNCANFFNIKGTSCIISNLKSEKLYKKRYKLFYI